MEEFDSHSEVKGAATGLQFLSYLLSRYTEEQEWPDGVQARDADLRVCDPASPEARYYSLEGALQRSLLDLHIDPNKTEYGMATMPMIICRIVEASVRMGEYNWSGFSPRKYLQNLMIGLELYKQEHEDMIATQAQ